MPREGLRVGTVVLVASLLAVVLRAPGLGSYSQYVLALVVIQVIAILSLNLLMGYAGQVSLGQAAFVGIGAYAAAQFAAWHVPFPFTLVGAAAATGAIATLVGLPSLRIRGLQLAATTLAFGIMAEKLIFARPWDQLSTMGVAIPRPGVVDGGLAFLYLTVAGLLLVLAADTSIRRSRLGRSFLAVRDREDTAAARGVRVGVTKLLAYAASGVYAGIAGGLYAYLLERVTPDAFTIWTSLGFVAAVIVGGLGSWRGAIVAAAVFTGLPELLRPAASYAPLGGAVLLMIVPVARPEGLGWLLDRPVGLGRLRRRGRRHGRPAAPAVDENGRARAEAALGTARRSVSLSVPVRTLLRAREIRVGFGGLAVLTGIDLEVRRGEIVGLIGPNGAGKTTFFNCVSGFVRPSEGLLEYRGRDLLALPPSARAGLGIVRTFQQVGLCGPQTVWENVLIAQHTLASYGLLPGLVRAPTAWRAEAALRHRAWAALEVVGLTDLAGEKVANLPHGRQRLAEVAAALAAGPELLLLDEPAAGMTPEESAELGDRLLDLRARLGLTVFIIEHHVPLVARLSDQLYVFGDGRVLAQGAPEAVQRDPAVIAVYLGGTSPAPAGDPARSEPKGVVAGV